MPLCADAKDGARIPSARQDHTPGVDRWSSVDGFFRCSSPRARLTCMLDRERGISMIGTVENTSPLLGFCQLLRASLGPLGCPYSLGYVHHRGKLIFCSMPSIPEFLKRRIPLDADNILPLTVISASHKTANQSRDGV